MSFRQGVGRFTRPGRYIFTMLLFFAAVAFLAAYLFPQLQTSFEANPQLNGLIVGVLILGIIITFRQAGSVGPSVRWIEAYRESLDPARTKLPRAPSLVAAMAALLMDADSRGGRLSAVSTRAIMDSVGSRMDEGRELSRYMIGLLVFLGLLGTFWGLLETVQGVADTIGALNSAATSSEDAIARLIAGLEEPLSGMGTAFSSSLFGLAGSLVLGFLDLQAGQAQNRLYNEIEEWLSTMTSSTAATPSDGASANYAGEMMDHTVESLGKLERALAKSTEQNGELVDYLRRMEASTAKLADETPRGQTQMINELRDEIRELTRTIVRLGQGDRS